LAGEPVIPDPDLAGAVQRPTDTATITSASSVLGFAAETSNETATATGTVEVYLAHSGQQFTGIAENISLMNTTQINTNVVLSYDVRTNEAFRIAQSTTTNGVFTINKMNTATGEITGQLKASEQVNA
jgi:hypothetical protein